MMTAGDRIPEVLGVDQDGNEVKASDFAGRNLVLYFYPKDGTSGCTAEAVSMRDNLEALAAKGYTVVGVSSDSQASHRRFRERQELPFTLISDPDHTLQEQMGVWGEKKMAGRTYMGTLRTTFLVDGTGTVTRVFQPREIRTREHACQILSTL